MLNPKWHILIRSIAINSNGWQHNTIMLRQNIIKVVSCINMVTLKYILKEKSLFLLYNYLFRFVFLLILKDLKYNFVELPKLRFCWRTQKHYVERPKKIQLTNPICLVFNWKCKPKLGSGLASSSNTILSVSNILSRLNRNCIPFCSNICDICSRT